MVLADSFYYQPVQIDTINTRVNADLFAKEGDVNGRGILLTLTENGLMKDTTGIALNLKWEHMSVGNQGVDNFEEVDLTKGLYKITYPIEMLNLGTVRAYIQIIDNGKSAGIRNLKITIERGVGDDTVIVRSDSFTALAQALIDVNNLEKTYALELNSVKQQLVEKASLTQLNAVASGAPKAVYATLSALQTAFPSGNTNIYLVTGDVKEVATLTVTGIPTVAGNITLTLNGVVKTIAVDPAVQTTTDLLATLIRSRTFTGWTTSGTGSVVIFTATTGGARTDGTFDASTTGVTATITTTTQGTAADGKWYYWNGSAWTAGGTYQATGVADKSQGLSQLSADLPLSNYPFTNPSVRKDLLKFGVVLDAVLIGADRTKAYTIGGLRKNFGGTNNTRIQVHEWDLTTGAWAGGSAETAIRASWSKDNYVPAKTTEIVKLAAIGTSGFKVELLVDWTKIPDGISYSWEGGHFHYFHPNTISKGQTFLPNVFKSRQNIDKTFPDNAFYTGHWFKNIINAKECISTNLFGAEINLIFKGPRITINTEVVDYNVSLYAAIDGVGSSWIDLKVSGEKVIKSGLADTEHILTLWTQPRFGDTADASPFFSGKGSVNIVGFNVPTFPIYGSKRTLVFYGDSITAGQADRFIGYAKRVEQFLPVNTIRIAQPAAPLVRRTDRPFIPTLQQFYNQASDGMYARPAPGDVILINIGTNDTSGDVTQLEFETALTNLVTGLNIRHSGAPICLISPFGGYRATETVNVAAATGVYLVDTTGWTYTTADGLHPDEAGGIALAQKLSADLIDKFGFDFFN